MGSRHKTHVNNALCVFGQTLLIDNLMGPLGAAPTDPNKGAFVLNLKTLSILYRHALILRKYKLKVEELFFVIRAEPSITDDHLTGLADIDAFIGLIEWQKASNYSLAELAFILGEPLHGNALFQDAGEMAYDIWSQIQAEKSLLFADTIFAYSEGISEAQSRDIITANAEIIVKADLRKYEISSLASEPSTFNLDIPSPIKERLSAEQRSAVIAVILKIIAEHLSPDAAAIPSDALEDVEGLTAEESEEILNASDKVLIQTADPNDGYLLADGVKANPSAIGVTIPDTIWDALVSDTKKELYIALIQYMQPGAPEVSDRMLVGIAGLGLEESQEILTLNAHIFKEIESDVMFWLSPDFNPEVLVNVPADIPLPASKAQEIVLAKHVSKVVPNLISNKLGISSERLEKLAMLGEYDFKDDVLAAELTRIAHGMEPLTSFSFEDMTAALQRLAVWFKDKNFDPDTLKFIRGHSGRETEIFKINIPTDYLSPSLKHIQEIEMYRKLQKRVEGEPDELQKVLTYYNFGLDGSRPNFPKTYHADLASILKAEPNLIGGLNNVIEFPNRNEAGDTSNQALKALHKFLEVVGLVQYLGIGAEALPLFVPDPDGPDAFTDLAAAVRAVVTAIRTKYDTEEEWEKNFGPFDDKIREQKRDALTDHLIHTFQATLTTDRHWFRTPHDLYNYFLIDTELEGCARTSRVVAGISSLQLYIQRCLLNLEQNEDNSIHVLPEYIPAEQWEWRKNYRVWEANRKVFLYPENYIEPDLRDNKTELFKTLESELLQQEITAQNALDAYAKYMKGFEEISNLKIAGAYHHLADLENIKDVTSMDKAADTLHLFGVTSSEPPIYYYRTIENMYKKEKDGLRYGVKYNPWQKLNLQVPVKKVSPIVYNGKLYLFWVEIVTRPKNEMIDGSNQFSGYEHKMSVKFSSLQLDGTWQAPQKLELDDPIFERGVGVIWDPLMESEEIRNWPADDLSYSEKLIYISNYKKDIRENEELLSDPGFAIPQFSALLKPKYELGEYERNKLHLEPKDDYTLKENNGKECFRKYTLMILIYT